MRGVRLLDGASEKLEPRQIRERAVRSERQPGERQGYRDNGSDCPHSRCLYQYVAFRNL